MYLVRDDIYPPASVTAIRYTARAMVLFEEKLIFSHILIDDLFGHRDHLETPGGGLEAGETPAACLVRELEEELGATGHIVASYGQVGIEYRILKRTDVADLFLFEVEHLQPPHLTAYEQKVLKKPVFLTLEEAKAEFDRHLPLVGGLIYQRERYHLLKASKDILHLLDKRR